MSIGEILLRSRYQPLKRVLSYDVFNTGFNGWMTLMPNFTEYPDFDVPKTLVNKDQWPPVMLSSATFRYPGTHGAMSGTYSLKLSTRPVAAPYTEIPAEGCLGHAIKRLSFSRPGCKYLQIECWLHTRRSRMWWMAVTVRNRVCMRVPSAILVWDSMYRRVENVTM